MMQSSYKRKLLEVFKKPDAMSSEEAQAFSEWYENDRVLTPRQCAWIKRVHDRMDGKETKKGPLLPTKQGPFGITKNANSQYLITVNEVAINNPLPMKMACTIIQYLMDSYESGTLKGAMSTLLNIGDYKKQEQEQKIKKEAKKI